MVMGMRGIRPDLERWQLDLAGARSRMYLAPTPRERERWHALWLLCRYMTASATDQAPCCEAHTIDRWATAFGEGGPAAPIFEQSGDSPSPRRGTTGGVEGCGAEDPGNGGHSTGQLVLSHSRNRRYFEMSLTNNQFALSRTPPRQLLFLG